MFCASLSYERSATEYALRCPPLPCIVPACARGAQRIGVQDMVCVTRGSGKRAQHLLPPPAAVGTPASRALAPAQILLEGGCRGVVEVRCYFILLSLLLAISSAGHSYGVGSNLHPLRHVLLLWGGDRRLDRSHARQGVCGTPLQAPAPCSYIHPSCFAPLVFVACATYHVIITCTTTAHKPSLRTWRLSPSIVLALLSG